MSIVTNKSIPFGLYFLIFLLSFFSYQALFGLLLFFFIFFGSKSSSSHFSICFVLAIFIVNYFLIHGVGSPLSSLLICFMFFAFNWRILEIFSMVTTDFIYLLNLPVLFYAILNVAYTFIEVLYLKYGILSFMVFPSFVRILHTGVPASLLSQSQASSTFCGIFLIYFLSSYKFISKYLRFVFLPLSLFCILLLIAFPNATVIFSLAVILFLRLLFPKFSFDLFKHQRSLVFFLIRFILFIACLVGFSNYLYNFFFYKFTLYEGHYLGDYQTAFFGNILDVYSRLNYEELFFGVPIQKLLELGLKHADNGLLMIAIQIGFMPIMVTVIFIFHQLITIQVPLNLRINLSCPQIVLSQSVRLNFDLLIFLLIGWFHYTPFFFLPGGLITAYIYFNLIVQLKLLLIQRHQPMFLP